jgi:hypothetical protein
MGESPYERTVEIAESQEAAYFLDRGGTLPVSNTLYLDGIHLDLSVAHNHTQVLDFLLGKEAFFRFEVEVKLFWLGKDMVAVFFVFFQCAISMNDSVIHIDVEVTPCNLFLQTIIRHSLKGCWGIGETEKHNGGLKQPFASFEGGLPLVSFLYVDVVIPPANVKLGVPLFAREVMDEV